MLKLTLLLLPVVLLLCVGLVIWQARRRQARLAQSEKLDKLLARARHTQELADTWSQICRDSLVLHELYRVEQDIYDSVLMIDNHNAPAMVAQEELNTRLAGLVEDPHDEERGASTALGSTAEVGRVQTLIREIRRILRKRSESQLLAEDAYQQAEDSLRWAHFLVEIDTCKALAESAIADTQYLQARHYIDQAMALVKKSDVTDPRVESAFNEVAALSRSVPGFNADEQQKPHGPGAYH